MTPIRPMPMNIPYFKYTISDKTVTFQSMETGTSYAWDFGDGTTSTLQNPTKTYSTTGTKTVSLTVTFANASTRTTTEPVIVEGATTAKRYLRIEQVFFDGASRFSTPTLANFSMWNGSTKLIGNNPTWGRHTNAFINDGSSWYAGLTSIPTLITNEALNTNPSSQTQLVTGTGVRVSGDDAFYRTQWTGVADMFGLFNNITHVKLDAAAIPTSNTVLGGGTPPLNGPTYNIYTTNYIGDDFYTARNSAWTLLGSITPTNMSTTALTTYTLTL
jgi:PKD repeat protein